MIGVERPRQLAQVNGRGWLKWVWGAFAGLGTRIRLVPEERILIHVSPGCIQNTALSTVMRLRKNMHPIRWTSRVSLGQTFGRCVTKFAPHKELKLIA